MPVTMLKSLILMLKSLGKDKNKFGFKNINEDIKSLKSDTFVMSVSLSNLTTLVKSLTERVAYLESKLKTDVAPVSHTTHYVRRPKNSTEGKPVGNGLVRVHKNPSKKPLEDRSSNNKA